MTRRFLTLGLAAAVLGLGGMNARAGDVTLASLLTPGATLTAGNLEFSDFTFGQTTGTPPDATGITVTTTPSVLPAPGIEFHGFFFAAAGTVADWSIGFRVTGLNGFLINDASLGTVGGNNLGTGTADVAETVTWPPFAPPAVRHLEATVDSPIFKAADFPPQQFVTVTKDISVVGGSAGASVSVIDETFSVVPEPTSMALLGIGLSGLFTFRRFLKRAFVA